MSQVAEINQYAMVEKVVIQGDLSVLNPQERLSYYKQVCESVGLNPLTKPFEYIKLNSKLTLYAKRDATDQLRKIHGVSVKIVAREKVDDLYNVTAQATDKDGRTDESIGSVSLKNLQGDNAANAIMKAETKAKRRVTLSICGLGFLDETEISSIPSAKPVRVDTETGEIVEGQPSSPDAAVVVVPEDVKNRVHNDTLYALEQQDAELMKKAWDGIGADEKAVLWRMFNSAQRSAITKLVSKGT